MHNYHDKDASRLAYFAPNGKRGTIYWWKKGDYWYWVANGNSGRDYDREKALDQARRWIRDGKL